MLIRSTRDETVSFPHFELPDFGGPVIGLRDTASGRVHPIPTGTISLSLGASSRADLRIEDPYASAIHCLLERLDTGRLLIADRASKNGVFVDGVRVSAAELSPGSELRIGRTTFFAFAVNTSSTQSAEELLVGEHPTFRAALELARRAARSKDCSVLILGETGTGKELIAQLIHEHSRRARKPFVALNCGALTTTLIGSELFGHVRGAFTGAREDRTGVFAQADSGTLFLDEVGELPKAHQPHLLRALECGEFRPLGGAELLHVDVRFVAATNRTDLASSSRLRSDLYHRLATVVIKLPALRSRVSDIPLLIREFIRRESGCDRAVSPGTMAALKTHPWRGNIRELRHSVMRALALETGELTLSSFLPEVASAGSPRPPVERPKPKPLGRFDEDIKRVLAQALIDNGSVRRAARSLGMPKSTFSDRARRLGLI